MGILISSNSKNARNIHSDIGSIQLPEAEARHRAQFEFEDETPLLKARKLKSSSFVGIVLTF